MVESEKGASDIWIVLRNKILKLFSSHWWEIPFFSWKIIIYSFWQIHPKLKIDQNVAYALFALNHSITLRLSLTGNQSCKSYWTHHNGHFP